ncbi:hypothetical protein M5362_25120 [Streptomyces sp. Je 1-79]|uniref:hypothetical protein n=1 Tax=Streptomyces sp. Je 1-79 TaxID=2943847 RepID=UPI0021A8FC56|nr:hypothetical protein [Streptomyces sp. Je 1-79]MCT4356414.1 hypothetical protein [Streptomyces sp. Je 1-79]
MTNELAGDAGLVETDALPVLGRPDAGLVMISEWRTEDAERQRTVMDGVVDAWARARLPETFLSRYCLAGSDGRTILNIAQWASPEAHLAFAADPAGRRDIADAVQALITVGPPGRYRHERTVVLRDAPVRSLGTTAAEDGVAQYFHRDEDGRRVHVLTAHEDDGDGTVLRFRPHRGLVRTAAREAVRDAAREAVREAVRPRG